MSPRIHKLLLTTTALLTLGSLPGAAGPDGANVVGGSATVQGQGTASVIVNQTSDRAIINWTTFNIGTNETTRFNQPGSSSIALNRVVGGLGPSMIDGTLTANGRVFVINGDGILFGPRSVINTAGFLATTSDIKNSDFMAGRMNFNQPGRPDASIVNQGSITATSGGFAALVAPGVRNTGTISATLGTVALAAGNMYTLDLYGDRLIQLGVDDKIAAQVKDVATGAPLNALVSNEGKLRANGGRVEITAAAARQVIDSVINNTGVVEADSVGRRNGMIVIGAATGASKGAGAPKQTVKLSGTLSAAGKKQDTKGGTIQVTGEDIRVAGARIDASGRAGGGKVMIGGDWAGGHPDLSLVNNPSARLESHSIATATTVSVDAATTIDASAKDSGNGGKVVLWSDAATTFAGTIFARGGSQSGDGGFVEVSGKDKLSYTGFTDLHAPAGTFGTLLLDPKEVTISTAADFNDANISTINVTTLQNQLAGANVIVTTGGAGSPGAGNGNINVNNSFTWATGTTLMLSAFRDINVAAGVTIANIAGGTLVLRADSTGIGSGTVRFPVSACDCQNPPLPGKIDFSQSTGSVSIYYDPTPPLTFGGNKYQTPTDFGTNVTGTFTAFMLVNNAADLSLIATDSGTLGRTYALGADFSAVNFTGFGPGTTFTGLLDGNGGLGKNYTISDLTLSSSQSQNAMGLFPFIGTTGVVRNLNLATSSIGVTADANIQFIGMLAGQNEGTISNVTVSGTVNGGSLSGIGAAGGLVGQNTGTITNSSASGDVTGGFVAGGFVGINAGSIASSSASGNVNGATFSGGFVGINGDATTPATITGSSASGQVTGALIGGGFFGLNNFGSIERSFATGAVNGDAGGFLGGFGGVNLGTVNLSFASGAVTGGDGSFAGGFVGMNIGFADPNLGTPSGKISRSYALGAVTGGQNSLVGGFAALNLGTIDQTYAAGKVAGGTGSTLGGLVGSNNFANFFPPGVSPPPGVTAPSAIVTNSYWDKQTSGVTTSDGGTGLTTAQMRNIGNFAGFDFQNVWAPPSQAAQSSDNQAHYPELYALSHVIWVKGADESRTYGAANPPSFSAQVGNLFFRSGDDASIVTGLDTVSTSMTQGSNVGFHPIVGNVAATSSDGATYRIVYTGGLTINPATLTYTADSASRLYGSANPGFNGTVTGFVNNDTLGSATTGTLSFGSPATTASSVGNYAINGSGLTANNGNYVFVQAAVNANALNIAPRPLTITANDTSKIEGQTLTFAGTEFVVSGLANVNGDIVTALTLTSAGAAASAANSSFPIVPSNAVGSGLGNYTISFVNGTLTVNATTQNQTTPPIPPPVNQQVTAPLVIPAALPADVVNTQSVLSPLPPSQLGTGLSQTLGQPTQEVAPGLPPRVPGQTAFIENRFFVPPPINETRLRSNEAVLHVGAGVSRDVIEATIARLGFTILDFEPLGSFGTNLIRLSTNNVSVRDAILALARERIAAAATANFIYTLTQDPAARATENPQGDAAQYILGKLRLSDIHRAIKGTNIPIAVIDSQIDTSHPDLEGVFSGQFDATGSDEPPHAHGTGMAGAIASHRKLLGIAPGAHLLAIRAFSSKATSAESTTFNILKGIEYAINNGVRIVNMSFAGPRDPTLERALKVAHSKGIVLIAAAGNAGPKSPPLYPAADPNVIAVTATDVDDKLFAGANRGRHVAIAAPGVDILVAAPESAYQLTTGTSVATAHISGIVALLLERNPKLTPDDIRKILTASAKRLGPNNEFGAGLVDPAKALRLAEPKSADLTTGTPTRAVR